MRALAFVVVLASHASADPAPATARPAHWAAPLVAPGLPNLHRVDAHLLRGAQPTRSGVQRLEAMGVKTIVSLRDVNSDRLLVRGTSLSYERIPMKTWHPEPKDIARFLSIVTDPARQPVFVHCQHGADRTGLMTAVYRVAVQGWSKEEALDEMQRGGFGFHRTWKNLLVFLRELEMEPLIAHVHK
jgi:protein tyrosine phosphatase (PTP) superfamily phosphohydrolase (DUF442 family)